MSTTPENPPANVGDNATDNSTENKQGSKKAKQLQIQDILSKYEKNGFSDADYLRQVVETDIGVKFLREMEGEFSKAHALANRSEAEVYEARWLVRVRTNQFFYEHPPRSSKMTGSYRQLVLKEDHEPITTEQAREILSIEAVLLARITQSREMEQQKILKEMRQEQSLTREDNSQKSGIRAKLGL